MKWINRLFILFLGIVLSITTGFGLAAFYPEPVMPVYPSTPIENTIPQSCYSTPQLQATPECQQLIQKQNQFQKTEDIKRQVYDGEIKTFQNISAGYTRTAVFFGIVIGALFAIVGIGIIKISRLVATGLLLAGILTAILTRLLISLASLGAATSGTSGASAVSFMEFGILLLLSFAVVFIGLQNLKDTPTLPIQNIPQPEKITTS